MRHLQVGRSNHVALLAEQIARPLQQSLVGAAVRIMTGSATFSLGAERTGGFVLEQEWSTLHGMTIKTDGVAAMPEVRLDGPGKLVATDAGDVAAYQGVIGPFPKFIDHADVTLFAETSLFVSQKTVITFVYGMT
jgi:hypothetical protein